MIIGLDNVAPIQGRVIDVLLPGNVVAGIADGTEGHLQRQLLVAERPHVALAAVVAGGRAIRRWLPPPFSVKTR
jgi:hypothetical protein